MSNEIDIEIARIGMEQGSSTERDEPDKPAQSTESTSTLTFARASGYLIRFAGLLALLLLLVGLMLAGLEFLPGSSGKNTAVLGVFAGLWSLLPFTRSDNPAADDRKSNTESGVIETDGGEVITDADAAEQTTATRTYDQPKISITDLSHEVSTEQIVDVLMRRGKAKPLPDASAVIARIQRPVAATLEGVPTELDILRRDIGPVLIGVADNEKTVSKLADIFGLMLIVSPKHDDHLDMLMRYVPALIQTDGLSGLGSVRTFSVHAPKEPGTGTESQTTVKNLRLNKGNPRHPIARAKPDFIAAAAPPGWSQQVETILSDYAPVITVIERDRAEIHVAGFVFNSSVELPDHIVNPNTNTRPDENQSHSSHKRNGAAKSHTRLESDSGNGSGSAESDEEDMRSQDSLSLGASATDVTSPPPENSDRVQVSYETDQPGGGRSVRTDTNSTDQGTGEAAPSPGTSDDDTGLEASSGERKRTRSNESLSDSDDSPKDSAQAVQDDSAPSGSDHPPDESEVTADTDAPKQSNFGGDEDGYDSSSPDGSSDNSPDWSDEQSKTDATDPTQASSFSSNGDKTGHTKSRESDNEDTAQSGIDRDSSTDKIGSRSQNGQTFDDNHNKSRDNESVSEDNSVAFEFNGPGGTSGSPPGNSSPSAESGDDAHVEPAGENSPPSQVSGTSESGSTTSSELSGNQSGNTQAPGQTGGAGERKRGEKQSETPDEQAEAGRQMGSRQDRTRPSSGDGAHERTENPTSNSTDKVGQGGAQGNETVPNRGPSGDDSESGELGGTEERQPGQTEETNQDNRKKDPASHAQRASTHSGDQSPDYPEEDHHKNNKGATDSNADTGASPGTGEAPSNSGNPDKGDAQAQAEAGARDSTEETATQTGGSGSLGGDTSGSDGEARRDIQGDSLVPPPNEFGSHPNSGEESPSTSHRNSNSTDSSSNPPSGLSPDSERDNTHEGTPNHSEGNVSHQSPVGTSTDKSPAGGASVSVGTDVDAGNDEVDSDSDMSTQTSSMQPHSQTAETPKSGDSPSPSSHSGSSSPGDSSSVSRGRNSASDSPDSGGTTQSPNQGSIANKPVNKLLPGNAVGPGPGIVPAGEAPASKDPGVVDITEHVLNEICSHAAAHDGQVGHNGREIYGTLYCNSEGIIRYYHQIEDETFLKPRRASIGFKPEFYNYLRRLAEIYKDIDHRLCSDVHSHPGGNPEQSPADERFARRVWRNPRRNHSFVIALDSQDGHGPDNWTITNDGHEVRKQIDSHLIRVRAYAGGTTEPKQIRVHSTMGG